MGKYDVLTEVASKLRALDNEVKLKILVLLVEEGSKSITDISKELDLNFSTAHKYLEQLEAAGLVTSKQVSENRLKRLFYVRDFDIELSPKGLSELISGKKKESTKGKFKVLNEKGELVDFDEKLFAQKYLKRGMPRGTIVTALNSVLEQAYDGITLLEIREIFRQALQKKIESIESVFEQIEESERHKRTYAHILQLTHPEALAQHAKGDIFIRNLRDPKLFNFVHDLRGIYLHGVNGKKISTFKEFLNEILDTTKKIMVFASGAQAIDSFNSLVAPLTKGMPKDELRRDLKEFFAALDGLQVPIFIGLDYGKPEFTKFMSPSYFTGKEAGAVSYADFSDLAELIYAEVMAIMRENKLANVALILKLWTRLKDTDDIVKIKNLYIANLQQAWQGSNASYVGELSRFDSDWKRWIGTVRVGEIQDIVLNLPRLAIKAKSEEQFLENLRSLLDQILEYIFNMAELTMGEFLRKHDTYFKSTQRGSWNYAPTEDFKYSVSLTCLRETIKILTGKDHSVELAKKILKFCDDHIQVKTKIPLRILLREDTSEVIANRFYSLDAKENKLLVDGYTAGIGGNYSDQISLHRFLPGGHCALVPKAEIKSVLKKEFGLIKLT